MKIASWAAPEDLAGHGLSTTALAEPRCVAYPPQRL